MIRTKIDFGFNHSIVAELEKKYYFFMLEVKEGAVYLLAGHWKYLDWRKKSERILLYTHAHIDDGYYYYYHKNQFHKL